MQAVILAAGNDIRLNSNNSVPKCLVKIGKKTVMEHILSQLPNRAGEVFIIVSPKNKGLIKKQIGINYAGKHIGYIEQEKQLGTGHALFTAKDVLKKEEKFLVLMADNLYLKRDIEKCLNHNLCILVKNVEAPERFGMVKVKNNFLEDIIEGPKITQETLINCGLYVLDKRIFEHSLVKIAENEFGLPQQISKMSFSSPVNIERATFWMSIGTIQDLKQADSYLKKLYI